VPSSIDRIVTRLNYGNSIARLGRREEAIEQYTAALNELAEHPERLKHAQLEAHINTVLAEEALELGRMDLCRSAFERARPAFERDELDKTPAIHFHSKAGRILSALGSFDEALMHFRKASALVAHVILGEPRVDIWERMLGEWSRVTAGQIALELRRRTPDGVVNAITTGEAAKGRLMAWIRSGHHPDGARDALAEQRTVVARERVRRWIGETRGRAVVSFFGADEGLALSAMYEDGDPEGEWIGEARYQQLMTDEYEPWLQLFERRSLHVLAGPMTERWLDRIGRWLWRACPRLARGGSDLVMIPHRLFRSLPLAHVRFPDGRRLTELFDRVLIVPTLGALAGAAEDTRPLQADAPVTAFADPDGTLGFARLEGLLIAGAERFVAGPQVLSGAVDRALRNGGVVLLSCHGSFDADNPWSSRLALADRGLELNELLGHNAAGEGLDLLVLGACEAGRQRRSMSDEPVGFTGALVEFGVRAVLAPLWKVDDLAASLFLTRFFELYANGVDAARASQSSSDWLRSLTAPDAVRVLESWIPRTSTAADDLRGQDAPDKIARAIRWLRTLRPDVAPFRSARDWAAFQLVGVPRQPQRAAPPDR
jgi:CHAT domain-containing protein